MTEREVAADAAHVELGPESDGEEATVISTHRTSQGVVRYRRWPGGWTVELLDEPSAVLAWVHR